MSASRADFDSVRGTSAAAERSPAPTGRRTFKLKTAEELAAISLSNGSGLVAQISACGSLFALRHERTLINQVLPIPAEDGIFRLLVRRHSPSGAIEWARCVGHGIAHARTGDLSAEWISTPMTGVSCRAVLTLHPSKAAWAWRIELRNTSAKTATLDVLMAQDVGLGDEGAVRSSEAFASQYIDILPVADPQLGWVILARQNIEMAGGRFPWLATACTSSAPSYCTDSTQFFGIDHRLTGEPAAARAASLASKRLQYEGAMAGLQCKPITLAAGQFEAVTFVCRFASDHREASSAGDLSLLREVLPADWSIPALNGRNGEKAAAAPASSIFATTRWLHGDPPRESDWAKWFPGERRHLEKSPEGEVLSFFCEASTHVVSCKKEAYVARPHGHILRSGEWRWIDPGQFGTTCYAAGVFSTQAYLGNQSLALLLPVVRDWLGIGRSAGQRVFMRVDGAWRQLGIPSAFVMTPSDVRWIYRFGADHIEARVWCSATSSASFLHLSVGRGTSSREFLVTHTLALDANEFDHAGRVHIECDGSWVACVPDRASAVGQRAKGVCFAIAAAEPGSSEISGDEALFADGASRGVPCVAIRAGNVESMGVILCGSLNGASTLSAVVDAARSEWASRSDPSAPPTTPVRLSLPQGAAPASNEAVRRIDEVLPWFVHNAAVHFTAPHGLEQHGGAAWGVRDVCQGSIEWLVCAGEWSLARKAIETVFSQQYAHDGSWPQWFMHPPYQTIRQIDSHGDVCFWPVKALCDYIEASNDFGILKWKTQYTSETTFDPEGAEATLLEHCDRVVDLCESRFVQGTALVNYGDGDWDDTLRPADPKMRTRMISSWTVALAFHAFRQLAEILCRADDPVRSARVRALLTRMRNDFKDRLMPGSVVAGFLVAEPDGSSRPLLHPSDSVTGIRYRLLPMTRSVLAELFSPQEAAAHMKIVDRELHYPDGVRLMSEPATYHGGCERLFKRADTAANVGREIGLQYVHAHLRYAEAMAKIGDGERLWKALQVVNPVGLVSSVPSAEPRQSNVYFSSSDADFDDRVEAEKHWQELRSGRIRVRGGWRLYSSGPGLFIHKVRSCLLGIRESFDTVVFDPVLPPSLDGLTARTMLLEHDATVTFRVRHGMHSPTAVSVNGMPIRGGSYEKNPYRKGGLCVRHSDLRPILKNGKNTFVVEL